MAHVIRSSLALADLEGIWGYIAVDNPAAADGMIRRLDTAFELLATNPLIGEQYRGAVRRFAVATYVVFYRPVEGGIEVARVIHGARRHEDHI